MEGSYTKIIETRDDVPSSTYSNFMENLVSTVREEIAACSEKAYGYLPIDQACKLFMFSSEELKNFCESVIFILFLNSILLDIY